MISTTIPAMRVEPIACNDPFTEMFKRTWRDLIRIPSHGGLPQAYVPEGPLVTSFEENQDDTMCVSSVEFGDHFINPTPINHDQMTIVQEIKLGSWWCPHGNIELLKQLLVPGHVELQETAPPIPNSSVSVSEYDHHTSSTHGGVPRNEEDDEASQTGNKAAEKWNERFHTLVKYREKHGHCLVPHHWVGDRQLAQWVKRQRYQFKLKCEGKHSTLSDERMKMLNKVGFVWSRHSVRWEERYNELVDFAGFHGHCHVPCSYQESPQLSVWVRCQRRQYKLAQSNRPSYMTRERFLRLNHLGFAFHPRSILK